MGMTLNMVTIDCLDPQKLATFWVEAAGYTLTDDSGDFFVLIAPGLPALGLQRVTHLRPTQERIRLCFNAADQEAEIQRLSGLGAAIVSVPTNGQTPWSVLADPEGNEFWVV